MGSEGDAQPSQLSDFTFLDEIGHGSFGTVHKVKRKADGSIYVIKQVKILAMSRKEQEAAINEVRILASLDSPYVIKYYDSFIDGDSLNIVMELAENGNLSQWLKRHRAKPVPEKLVWRFFVQLVAGMHHIHERNIVHRDLKALNIMLDKEDNIKIGDLGVAKVLTTHLRAAHTGVGTPYYLSPEVAQRRPYNAKSDVWALGCILYECCTRRHPFTGNTQAQLFQQIIRATYRAIPTQYSKDVHACVKACLTRSVEQRPSPLEIMLMPAFLAKAKELGVEMPREVQLRLSGPGRAVPTAQPAAAFAGSDEQTGAPGARRRAAHQAGVPQPEPEPEPEPSGPPRAELRPRPSSARPRSTGAAAAAAGHNAAAKVAAGLQAARPRSAGGQDAQSRQRARQQKAAAARLSNPLVPAVRRGQRRSGDAADLPPPGGDIGLGVRRRRPASAGSARQRPSSAGPRQNRALRPFALRQNSANGVGNGSDAGSGAGVKAPGASGSGSPRTDAGPVPNSAGTPRRGADDKSVATGGATPSQVSGSQPQRTAAAEMMARRGLSPGGQQQQQQARQRPSSAPVRRAGSREEAQRAADMRRYAAVKSPGARESQQQSSRHPGGWVSARGNRSDAVAEGNAARAQSSQRPLSAVSPRRMHQRRVVSNNDGAAHVMPGSSPTSHRVRQRNGFLRPSSAGVVSSAQRRPASAGARDRGSGRPTVQDLSGVRERLSGGRIVPGGARSSRPSSARLAQQRAEAAAHQKAVDDVRSLPAY